MDDGARLDGVAAEYIAPAGVGRRVWGYASHARTQWWILCARAFGAGRVSSWLHCTVSRRRPHTTRHDRMTRPCHLANCLINTDFIWARWHEEPMDSLLY